jgi:hypothetical protein
MFVVFVIFDSLIESMLNLLYVGDGTALRDHLHKGHSQPDCSKLDRAALGQSPAQRALVKIVEICRRQSFFADCQKVYHTLHVNPRPERFNESTFICKESRILAIATSWFRD